MQTPDLTANNIAKIAQLFPNVITEKEGKNGAVEKAVDFDLLRQVLQNELVEGDDERYRLDWPGKRASLLKANTPIERTLRPDRESSVNFETTQNLFIEGDNFEVLKILQESYLGKVKMIYIDPPYNTGKDFVYKDNFAQGKEEYEEEIGVDDVEGGKLFRNIDTNGRFHSDWLSMMYERLMLARNFLKENGVIFVSIDEHEISNLGKIMSEVFGAENFLTQLVILCNPKGRAQDKYFATNHEYVLVFSKNILPKGAFSIEKDAGQINQEYTEEDDLGKFRLLELRNTHREFGKHNRKNLYYPLYVDQTSGEVSLEETEGMAKIYPDWEDGFNGCWTWGKPKAEDELAFLFGKIVTGRWKIYVKDYANGASKMLKTILNNKKYSTEKGQKTLNLLFETRGKIFQAPKSIDLLSDLMKTSIGETDIILDFFSGSASAAHAVMAKNAEDGGACRFIMVQIPEETPVDSEARKTGYKTIAEIGKERIRLAGKKILDENTEALKDRETPLDIGFRVFKADTTNMEDVYYHPSELKQESLLVHINNVKDDRTSEDLLTQVILDLGLELSLPIEQKKLKGNTVYFVQGNALVACFDEAIDFSIVDEIAKLEPLKVVFRDSSFKEEQDRTNVETRFKRLSPDTVIRVL